MIFPPGCSYCLSNKRLSLCSACRVTHYCSREHQVLHRDQHASACKAVKKSESHLKREEQKLRNSPPDFWSPANPFETHVGHFWGILFTRDYMRARYALVDALLKIRTKDAVKSASKHVRDMLRLCRSDNMGVRDLLPALYLRLDQDQEAYDFVKWYETTGHESNYDWGDMSLPFLDVTNADALESPRYLCREFPSLTNQVCATLLKVKLLLDLRALQNASYLRQKLPGELVDRVKYFLPSTEIIRSNAEIVCTTDYTNRIQILSSQIDDLLYAINKTNRHFLPALIGLNIHTMDRPEVYTMGSAEEVHVKLQYWFDAWRETRGAIDVIHPRITSKPRLIF